MKIKEAIKKDRKRIRKRQKRAKIEKYKVTLMKKKSYSVSGFIFEKDQPSVVDGSLAKYLKITGLFKIEGIE